ncbi:Dimethyl-sulfide monooxygenase [Venturia nashicola]|nr:Dimethyl-sulfide monooxygenase [Venturia nashicola]
MDPLSIATGSASLATSCFKIGSILYTFIDETRSVDKNVAALIAEVKGLLHVLETVSKSLNHDALVGLRSSDHVHLWTMVEASLQECGTTLDKLETMLQDLNGTANSRFGVLRRPIMKVRLNMKLKEIGDFQQQVRSHYSGMQLTLGTINVCISLHSNSSQQKISRQLTDLKDQITLANTLALQQGTAQPGSSLDKMQDSRRISKHLRNLARDAESLRSSASTVIERDRSTVWGASVLGDQLSNDQYRDIRNWIPPPVEEESLEGESIGSGPISDAITIRAESDSESDLEQELVEMFEKRGLQKLADKKYEEAEKFLCKAISLRSPFSKTTTSLEHVKASLADCYCQQAKWEDADRLLSELSDSRNKLDILALYSLHAVSHSYFGKANLDAADRMCRKALLGKKKLLGKTHESYYHTLLLLACICDAKGDEVQGDAWRHFLPASLESQARPVPLDHQLRPKFRPSALLEVPQEIPQSWDIQPTPKSAAREAINLSQQRRHQRRMRKYFANKGY